MRRKVRRLLPGRTARASAALLGAKPGKLTYGTSVSRKTTRRLVRQENVEE